MRFSILGPLQVEDDDGQPVAVRRPGQRQTLTALLLLSHTPVTRQVLGEALWGDDPLAGALRMRLARVRAVVGAARLPAIEGDRYQLHVRPGELDYGDFRAHVTAGRAAMDAGNPEAASGHLQHAVNLCRDPLLPDLPPTPLMERHTARVGGELAAARDLLVDARLELGHHRELVAGLREAVAVDPLREHTWAQLILALYRCGRIAEALATSAEVRAILARECGTDPGPELADLQRRILERDPALDHCLLPPVPVSAAELPSWRAVHQLPAPAADFTGRRAELEALARQLPGTGMTVTVITGAPGRGKTALAVHAGHEADAYFPDGQLYVYLGGETLPRDPQDVLAEILRTLGVPSALMPPPGREREALYRSMLAHRKVLVVLDDAVSASQIRPLLPGTTGAAVLVTSRGRARFADLESARLVELDDMPPGDAVALLKVIAGPGKAASDEVYAAIAARCGYLPLALRIAGARLAFDDGLTPEDLARSLAGPDRLAELAIGDLSVGTRLASAYTVLGKREQDLARLAALHPTGDIPGWLPHVLLCDADAARSADAVVRVGLFSAVAAAGRPLRYKMSSLSREFAAAQSAAANPSGLRATTTQDRILDGWAELADDASRQLARHPCVPAPPMLTSARVIPSSERAQVTADALSWFDAERANLVAVTIAACVRGDHVRAAVLAERMFTAQCQLKAYADARQLWESIAAAARKAGDTLAAADARYRLAVLEVVHGDRQVVPSLAIRELTDYCLWEFRLAGRGAAAADTLYLLARVALWDDDPQRARRYAEKAVEEARIAGDQRSVMLSLSALGVALVGPGTAAAGIARCTEALEIATELQEPRYADLVGLALDRARALATRPPGVWEWHARATG